MKNQNGNSFWAIPIIIILLIPVLLIGAVLVLLYFSTYQLPRKYFQKRKLLREMEGKTVLFISNGNRMKEFANRNRQEIESTVDCVEVMSNENLLAKLAGIHSYLDPISNLPALVFVKRKKVLTRILRNEYTNLGRKTITQKEWIDHLKLNVNELKD